MAAKKILITYEIWGEEELEAGDTTSAAGSTKTARA